MHLFATKVIRQSSTRMIDAQVIVTALQQLQFQHMSILEVFSNMTSEWTSESGMIDDLFGDYSCYVSEEMKKLVPDQE